MDDVVVLKEGIEAWNNWRSIHRNRLPDLSDIDLTTEGFPYIHGDLDDPYDGYLEHVVFHHTNLSGVRLDDICIRDADFESVDLEGADLTGSTFIRVRLKGANFKGADLRWVKFVESDLAGASFGGARVEGAMIDGVPLAVFVNLE